MKIRKLHVLIFLSAGALAGSVRADVIWDQSAHGPPSATQLRNVVDTNGEPPLGLGSNFGLSDVTVPASGWTIESISVYFGATRWTTGTEVTSAVLSVVTRFDAIPDYLFDPRPRPLGNGTIVPVTQVPFDGVNTITASGLHILLPPGSYWVELTPIGGGVSGPDNQYVSTNFYGYNQALRRNPPTGQWEDGAIFSGLAQGDGAILITGTLVPAPASLGLLGLVWLVTFRRR